MSTSRRRIWRCSTILTAAASLAIVLPAAAQTTQPVEIKPGALDAALIALAAQTRQQVIYTPDMVAGRKTAGVSGAMTVEQAIARLAPDFTVRRASPTVVVIKPAKAAPARLTTSGEAPEARPFGAEPPAEAQAPALATQPGPAPAAPTATVSELEVTGSHIRGASTPSPLRVVTHADLERSGQLTVADALRALPQNFGGGASEGAVTTGADKLARNPTWASAINLRGLGNNATLVLVDGHRMAGSGTFGDFVDVSTIPSAAVERVEILLDGASALYGSDAVGGVVNIITRKAFSGAETRILGGRATAGAPAQGQVSQTLGNQWDTGGVVFAYELQKRDHLSGDDRSFSASPDLRAFGGPDLRTFSSFPGNILGIDPVTRALVPSFAIPAGQSGVGLLPSQLQAGVVNRQNQRLGEDLLPEQTMNSVYLSAHQSLNSRLEVSADARYSARRFKAIEAAATSTLTVSRANPFFVAPNGATTENIAYSFANDLPNVVNAGDSKVLGLTLDAKLRLWSDWQSAAYVTYARETEVSDNANLVNSLALNEALGNTADNPATAFSTAVNGFFNPFAGVPGANSATIRNYIGSGFLNLDSRDVVWSANLQADGSLWSLPGGAVKLAVGGQVRHESLRRTGSIFVASVAPTPQAATAVSREVSAAFAELQAPLFGAANARPGLQKLELSLAGRVEHYESIGTTANPKVGVLWAPTEDLQIRGTYGTSFRAPALRELGDPSSFSPQQIPLSAGKLQVLTLSGGNPNLRPETATSWTFGADWRPARWPGLTAGFSAFDVQYRNRIDRPVSTNLAGALVDPTLASFVTRISPTTNAGDLALIQSYLSSPFLNTLGGVVPAAAFGAIVDNRYVNTAKLHVQGLDVTGADVFDVGDDRVTLGVNASYMVTYDLQSTPTSPRVGRVNTVNFPARVHARATADWTRGRLTLGAAFNYAGAYHDTLGLHIRDQGTFDLQARLAAADEGVLKGVSVLLNVRNVFDRDPPFYANPTGIAYDAANGDPLGRFVSLQLTRAW